MNKNLTIASFFLGALAFAQHNHHSTIDLNNSSVLTPSVSLKIEADAHSAQAYNLKLITESFRFAPDHVNQEHQLVDTEIGLVVEGHAHLYVNGEKVTRLYGPHFFLQNVNAGDLIQVVLNSNDHRSFTLMGYAIGEAVLRVPASAPPHEH